MREKDFAFAVKCAAYGFMAVLLFYGYMQTIGIAHWDKESQLVIGGVAGAIFILGRFATQEWNDSKWKTLGTTRIISVGSLLSLLLPVLMNSLTILEPVREYRLYPLFSLPVLLVISIATEVIKPRVKKVLA